MAEVDPGDQVLARDAFGELLPRRATTGVTPGRDFAVVWLCSEEEWQAASAEHRDPDALPWPAEDVAVERVPVGTNL